MESFFDRMKKIHPSSYGMINPAEISQHIHQSQEDYKLIVDSIKCIMCGCCTAQCPVTRQEDPNFIGPAAVLRAKRYIFDTRILEKEERKKIMLKEHGVWACKTYWRCTRVCPKGIQVTKNILDLKELISPEKQKTSTYFCSLIYINLKVRQTH